MARFYDVRPGEWRPTAAAFATLFATTAGHTLLETARDAMFLAKLPATQLPIVYVAIAATGLLISRLTARSSRATPLPIALLISAAITGAFFLLSQHRSALFLYALYLWTGVFGSWVVVQFWMLLGSAFTVVQAKRLFGLIGAGSVLGALLGAILARAIAGLFPPEFLLVAGAIAFVLAALGPGRLIRAGEPAPSKRAPAIRDDLRAVGGHPYVRRILLLVLLSTVALTTVDYVFKSLVAASVPKAELGAYFANVSIVLNAVSLVVQVAGVGWVMRMLGVGVSVQIMPALIVIGATGVFGGGGVIAAVILKGVDGSLRHSLQRTTVELLYVPLADALRARAKPFIDLLGQRGGQAAASLFIFAAVALGAKETHLAVGIAVLGAAWLWAAAGVRRHYLDLFRATLSEGRVDDRGDLPQLDLGALEALFTALNSSKDAEVICALDLLAVQARHRLIPALILYHPSRPVVLRALELFALQQRTDFVPIALRLLEHQDAEVRSAALRALGMVVPGDEVLRARLDDPTPEVRATAIVGLIARGSMKGQEAERALEASIADASPAVRIALARAIGRDASPSLFPALDRLAKSEEPEVRLEVAWAMGRTQSATFIAPLTAMLPAPIEGSGARDALTAIGAPAVAELDRALGAPDTATEVRRAIPRAISMFDGALAAPVLMRHLAQPIDGIIGYRILRSLGRLRANDPALPLDRAVLLEVTEATVKRSFELIGWRRTIELGAEADPRLRTPAGQLLATMLKDKEAHAIGRVLRVLGLLFPQESFDRIQRGLHSNDAKTQASSRELIENLLKNDLRASILALIDDLPDSERIVRALPQHRPAKMEHAELMVLLFQRSDELGTLAWYHARELGLVEAKAGEDPAKVLAAQLADRQRVVEVAR